MNGLMKLLDYDMKGICVDMISDAERTLVMLRRVQETYLPDATRTMVNNEINLLDRKVSDLICLKDNIDEGDDI